MKWAHQLFIVFSISLLMGCNQPEQVVEATWEDGGPKLVAYYLEEDGEKIKIKEEKYYENGQVEYIGGYDAEGLRNGHWQYFYPNGNLWSEGDFDSGMREGPKSVYWEDGTLRYEGQYNDNRETGQWIFYARDGSQDQIVTYENGEKKTTPSD